MWMAGCVYVTYMGILGPGFHVDINSTNLIIAANQEHLLFPKGRHLFLQDNA